MVITCLKTGVKMRFFVFVWEMKIKSFLKENNQELAT